VPLQFAGGLRGERDVETAIGLDVDRIVIGTAAVVRPELVAWALRRWGPDRVAVALEVKGGQVVTHGWQQTTPLTPVPFGEELYRMGVRTALYTDVDREGLLGGVDAAGAVALAEATGLRLVISGGVGGIEDIRALANAGDAVEGVVIGQALYTGRLSLPDALAAAA
jgi:phosphoribosylformimino-5-aminoimidazole carboxamide ribotide isomerase